MIFVRFAILTSMIAIALAAAADLLLLLLSVKHGGFVFMTKPAQWIIIAGIWGASSLALAFCVARRVSWRLF
jgi:hypothetical protein